MKLLILALCLSFFATPAFAAEYEGKVLGFYINKGNTALVKLDGINERLDCVATGSWQLKFDSSTDYGKQWVAMILAARMADKPIRVGFGKQADGSCNVSYFYFYG